VYFDGIIILLYEAMFKSQISMAYVNH